MEHKGTVYFFTGLSGAGKTTVGSLFYQRLKNTKPNAVYLDGDEIRVAFGEDVGYTNDERLRWAGRIFRVCRLLSDQGIDVVCCSIAMFDTVRRWNREHIPNYKEIYIRVKKETLIQRNQAKKEEKKRKKIRTGGFVDEIYEDDLEEEAPVQKKTRPVRNMQTATSEAHELLKKEIAAATAEDFSDDEQDTYGSAGGYTEEIPNIQEAEEEPEEKPVEIKKLAIPHYTASQLADKARKAGDAPDIVRDSITKVTLFDYSDIIGGDEESEE